MMSQVDMVASDFETLELVIGQIQMTAYDREQLEMALSNLRDSLRDIGVEVAEGEE
jgi:hypothetical protein